MIDIENNIENWDKKIVYAPNAFGKTRSSNFLYSYYKDSGSMVDIFTRRNIEDFISTFGSNVYLGKTAILEAKSAKLSEYLEKEAIISQTFNNDSETKVTTLKNNSFYCNLTGLKYNYLLPEYKVKIKSKANILCKYSFDEVKSLDSCLSPDLYNEIVLLIGDKEETKTLNGKFPMSYANNFVPKDIYDEIYDIYLYSKCNNVNQCYLCGKKYKNHNVLLESIEKRFDELIIDDSFKMKLHSLFFKCNKSLTKHKDNKILNNIFSDLDTNTIKRELSFLIMYKKVCDNEIAYLYDKLKDIPTDIDNSSSPDKKLTFGEVDKEIKEINKKIKNIESKHNNTKKFNDFIIREINKNIMLDDGIKINPLRSKYGVNFSLNGKKIKNIYDFLSESEIKRLSLIVLKAEIKYNKLDTIILDDPIDSYDDYNKRIACQYICDIISSKAIKHWYIFTNDFECVYFLTYGKSINSVFCLDDINKVFSNSTSINYVECSSKEVNIIACNDLYYLIQFVTLPNSKFVYDKDILFCALTLTLRNLKTEFIKKLSSIDIVDSVSIKNQWINDVQKYVEKASEHYDYQNSSVLTIKDIAKLYLSLYSSSRTSWPKQLSTNNTSFETYRENVAISNYVYTNSYTDVVNYLFKKIVIINYLKYELEKKLMNYLYKNFNLSDFLLVDHARFGLLSRINKAIEINSQNNYGLNKKLKEFMNIHEKYSSLYNTIDHGTKLIITPYLSTSIKELENFKNDVQNIKI